MSPEQLVAQASEQGIEALALTDIHNTSGVFPFVQACHEHGIKPLVGVEFRTAGQIDFIALARNTRGFRQINEFLTRRSTGQNEGEALESEHVVRIFPLNSVAPVDLKESDFIGIRPSEVGQTQLPDLRPWLSRMLMWFPVSFGQPSDYNTHRLLQAIDQNVLLSRLAGEKLALREELLLSHNDLLAHYRGQPQLIYNTMRLVEECEFSFDFESPKNRRTFTGARSDDRLLLEKLAIDGWKNRFRSDPIARERLDRELGVIDKLGFSPYFLITWDIIRYAKHRNFRHVGRGSGANSLVAYCMGITDVNPLELDLYFERFINPHRSSPPDFDIDFSWDERDEVIDYIFKRYGRRHTALLATYSTFKGRSIIRELGKVFGLAKAEIDKLVRRPNDPSLQDKVSKAIFKYGKRIVEFPNHLSIHAGGILISEEPIYSYTATELPPKGFPTTQFDMYVAEDVGLYKYDILSQRGLGHIKEAVDIVQENCRVRVNIDDTELFKRDEKVNQKLAAGDTIGCFYIESPAMRQLLRKLACSDYLTLVAASSIIRPGVAKSGMMREYIQRHHNPDDFEYLHPRMKELMEETYGVMVYQEDVIKVAHHFAGISLADADVLRRAMSGKYRSRDGFARVREQFFANCQERGHSQEVSREVWRQMESFGGYSFSKAHSASFAVESYQSLYLKTHYPREFMVAVINNFGGFYNTEFYVNEARRSGARVLPPCVNSSERCTAISGMDITLGLAHIKDLERDVRRSLLRERSQHGPFRGLTDFIDRVQVGSEQINVLIRVGAFRFTGVSKKRLLWDAALHFGKLAGRNQARTAGLFSAASVGEFEERSFELPELSHTRVEDAYDELELLGFALTDPYEMLSEELGEFVPASELTQFENRRVRTAGYLICTKDVRTNKGELMQFGTFLDPQMQVFDTIHFPNSLKQYPIIGRAVYELQGKVSLDFGMPTLEVDFLRAIPWMQDPRFADRDLERHNHPALERKAKRGGRWTS